MELLDRDPVQETGREKERTSDSTEFSNDSRAYNHLPHGIQAREGGALETGQNENEPLLFLEQLWIQLELWEPQPGPGLDLEIRQLQELYRQLLWDIMNSQTREQAGAYAARLNHRLLHIIDRMGDVKFPNLLFLLEKYGEKESADFLRASVLRRITGNAVSPRDVAAAREQKSNCKGEQSGSQPGPDRQDGILYSKAAGKGVGLNQRFMEQVRQEEQFRLPSSKPRGKMEAGAGFARFQEEMYSPAEIERAERFVRYINEKGNLYCNPALGARNEELLGFLMAVNMEKAQLFQRYGGVGDRLARDVHNALERFFRYQMPMIKRGLDVRMIQRMYYRVMELIQRTKAPGEGVKKGLLYAYESYLSKKYPRESNPQGRAAGFFDCGVNDASCARELKQGSKVLDEDWKEFLDSIGQNHNTLLQMMLSNCPWALLLDADRAAGNKKMPGPAVFLFIAGAVLFFLLARGLLG